MVIIYLWLSNIVLILLSAIWSYDTLTNIAIKCAIMFVSAVGIFILLEHYNILGDKE